MNFAVYAYYLGIYRSDPVSRGNHQIGIRPDLSVYLSFRACPTGWQSRSSMFPYLEFIHIHLMLEIIPAGGDISDKDLRKVVRE